MMRKNTQRNAFTLILALVVMAIIPSVSAAKRVKEASVSAAKRVKETSVSAARRVKEASVSAAKRVKRVVESTGKKIVKVARRIKNLLANPRKNDAKWRSMVEADLAELKTFGDPVVVNDLQSRYNAIIRAKGPVRPLTVAPKMTVAGKASIENLEEELRVLNKAIVVVSSIQAKAKEEDKSPYGILGVSKNVSQEDMTKAYRKLALKWHPDKWSNASTADREAAVAKFRETDDAYKALSNPVIRRYYDRKGKIPSEEKMQEFQRRVQSLNDLFDIYSASARQSLATKELFTEGMAKIKKLDPELANKFQVRLDAEDQAYKNLLLHVPQKVGYWEGIVEEGSEDYY